MKNKYITPNIKVKEIDGFQLMDMSLNGDNPTSGLPGDDDPTSGGTSTGGSGGGAGIKRNVFEDGFTDVWADDQWE